MATAEPIRPLTALRRGMTAAGRHLWQLAASLLVVFVLVAGALVVVTLLARRSDMLAALAGLSTAMLAAMLSLGLVRLSLRLHDGCDAGLGDLFACAGQAPGALTVAVAVSAMLLFAALPGLSLGLSAAMLAALSLPWGALAALAAVLTVALFAAAASRCLFVAHVMADRGAGPVTALRQAAALTRGHRSAAAGLIVLLALVNALGAGLAGIGLLFTVPVSMAAISHAYRTLAPAPVLAATSPGAAASWPAAQ